MRSRGTLVALALIGLGALGVAWVVSRKGRSDGGSTAPDAATHVVGARLLTVGPRLVSNQSAQPLSFVGEGLRPGMKLWVGAPYEQELSLTVVDERHAYVRLPSRTIPPEQAQASVKVSLKGGEGELTLTVVNDSGFFDPVAVERAGGSLFVLSPNTDEVIWLKESGERVAIAVGDSPRAIARYEVAGKEWIAVAHAGTATLKFFPADDPLSTQREVKAPAFASALAIDSIAGRAYVAEDATDTVVALALDTGKEQWRARVLPNPGRLALLGRELAVGSLQSGDVELLDGVNGVKRAVVRPDSGTAILGGGTEKYSRYIMGGSAPRAMVRFQGALLVASIGPNIGPNPDRMEVSMNGGVGVIDVRAGRFVRHLGFGAGVPEGLALDEQRGLLYVADVGLGLVRVVDAKALLASDASARNALLASVPIAPPKDFPLVRSAADFGVQGRAGVELHSGPFALALSEDGQKLDVLNRFAGNVTALDVSRAREAKVQVTATHALGDVLTQRTRRLGQVLYHADLGKSAMTCDACHPGGHTGGLLFEKTHPLRIYRSTTVRGTRDTPPYFNPPSTKSLAQTAQMVGGRNRFHNPDPSDAEVEALASFTAGIALRPNPFVGDDGAPLEKVTLPDGAVGNAREGLALFEGKADCAGCHPPPHFTLDQDVATRERLLNVGTPKLFPLRPEHQEKTDVGLGIPSLLGVYDNFPLLSTGAVGFQATDAGVLEVSTRFPLRELMMKHGAPPHGNAASLSEGELNDLLAYLQSL